MVGKPLAIDGLVINDGATWQSQFIDGAYGLPGAQALMASRVGRRPVAAGMELLAGQMTLRTIWDVASHTTRKLSRRALMQMLDPEKDVSRRLTMAEHVWPGAGAGNVLLSLGPWDVYGDGDGDWHARDVLRGDDLVMDMAGSWYTAPGEGLQCGEAFINYIPNPIFCGTYTSGLCAGYAAYATGTGAGTRSESGIAKYGNQAQRIAKTDGGADNYGVTETAGATDIDVANLSVWVYVVSYTTGAKVGLTGDGSDTGAAALSAELTLTDAHIGVWTRISDNATGLVEEETWTLNVFVKTANADVIFDGLQLTGTQYKLPTAHGDMPGCSWAGTAHASTSTWAASNNTITLSAADLPKRTGTVRFWVKSTSAVDDNSNNRWVFRWGTAAGVGVYIATNDSLATAMASTYSGFGALTDVNFAVDTWHCIHFVWDILVGQILYLDGAKFGDTKTYYYPAPTDAGLAIADSDAISGFIDGVLVLDSAMSAADVALDYANGRQNEARHVDVRCVAAEPWRVKGRESDKGLVSSLVVDEDARWRMRDGDYFRHVIRAGAYSCVIDNQGDVDAYPVLHITPRTGKSSGYDYKRWIPVKWRAENNYTRYPVDIVNDGFDTATLVTASKMQADGDDLRVMVDGIEVNRWLQNMNHATTQVWVNLDFLADRPMTLATAIADSGDVTTIDVNGSITFLPTSGILYIGTEAFTYTGKVNASCQFTGITRAAKSTSAAAHLADADVFWIQHDVWIVYGNAAATDPTDSHYDDYKPIIELTSTNTSWTYQEFGESTGLQSGHWDRPNFSEVYYGGTEGADADPWVELGLYNQFSTWIREALFNPCFITNANFTNGEKWNITTTTAYTAEIQSSPNGYTWTTEDTIADPSADDTWEAWSDNEAITAGSKYVALTLNAQNGKLEAADCVITLNSSYTPVVAIGSEVGNYPLALTIENEAEDAAIVLTLDMELDQVLIVDTVNKTVTYKTESQQQALVEVGGTRQDWLPLGEGENVISFSDADTVELDVEIVMERRMF